MNNQTRFILSAAANLLVQAYKKQIAEYQEVLPLNLAIAGDAPNNYESLRQEAANGILRVSTEFNETSIYGSAGNLTFRVFHDFGHILYDAEFTTDQEIALAQTQWLDIKRHIPQDWLSVCHTVYMADTVEQSKFEAETGNFPADQKTFVLGFLNKSFQ